MKHCSRMLVCVLAGVALNAGAIVSVSDGGGAPYQDIVSRNMFGLRPMVRPGKEASTTVISRPKIKLVGTTTLLGKKIAFLMLPADKSGGVPECLLLGEGEAQTQIQVLEINERAVRTIEDKEVAVRVINHGEEQTLCFEEPTSLLAVASVPGVQRSPMQMPRPEETSLTPEQQMLLIEAQRLKAVQDGDSVAKILPPTEFTPETTNGTP